MTTAITMRPPIDSISKTFNTFLLSFLFFPEDIRFQFKSYNVQKRTHYRSKIKKEKIHCIYDKFHFLIITDFFIKK